MKNNHRIKLIAASLALTTSLSAVGGLGGLNVQSNLGEPFSGTVTVTGEEAKVLLNGGNASLSDGNLRTSVRKSGDKAIINIRSNTPVNDPVLVFQVGVGSQSRQYTAIIDPADYSAGSGSEAQSETKSAEPAEQSASVQQARTPAKQSTKQAQEPVKAKKENKKEKTAVPAKTEKNRDAAPVVQKNLSSGSLTGNYKVRHGETLTSIAEKVRPQGLTLTETIHALVLANPKVFPDNNPDIVIAGSTLNIPSASVLKDTLKKGGSALRPKETPVETADVETQQSQQPAQASHPADTAGADAIAEKPVDTVASAESASAETAVKEIQASAVEAETASAPEVTAKSETEAASAATQPPVTEKTEGGSGWWRWLLFAGLGAIALWLLSKAAAKKKDHIEEIDDNDSIVLKETEEEDNVQTQNLHAAPSASSMPVGQVSDVSAVRPDVAAGVVAAAASAAVQAKVEKTAEEGLEVEDDFDDEIFFTETETISADKSEDDFNLDLGSIDRAQNGIVSGALTQDEETQKRANANWDTIESTDSVYEPEPENEYKHVAVEFTPAADAAEAVEASEKSGDSVADTSQSEHVVESTEAENATPIADIEIGQEENTVQDIDLSEVPPADSSDETVVDADVSVFEPLEFESSETEDLQKQAAVETETDALEQEEVGSSTEQSETHRVAVDYEDETESLSDLEYSSTESDGDIAFQDEDLGKPVAVNISDDVGTIEWESIEVGNESNTETGFISESVGMTAPLEAKYELAQMYVEIGDPDAARETLRELLEETDGNILEKVKNLLAELDK